MIRGDRPTASITAVRPLDGRAALAGIFVYGFAFPQFYVLFGSAGAILVNGGLILLILSVVFGKGGGIRFYSGEERQLYLGFFLTMLYYLIALSYSTIFLSSEILLRDLYEIHKPVLHVLCFSLPFLIAVRFDDGFLDRLLTFCFFIMLGFGWMGVLQLSPTIASLYAGEAVAFRSRLSIPFTHPYNAGFVHSFFVFFFLFKFLITRKFRYIPYVALATATLVVAQSSGAFLGFLIAAFIGIPIAVFLDNYEKFLKLRIEKYVLVLVFLTLMMIAAVMFVFEHFSGHHFISYLWRGLTNLASGDWNIKSITNRLEKLQWTLWLANDSGWIAFFGNGVSKSVLADLETTYTFFLFRYGLVGLVVIFLLPVLASMYLLARVLISFDPAWKYYPLALFAWMVNAFGVSVSNTATEQPRVSLLFYFCLGLSVRIFCGLRSSRIEAIRGAANPRHDRPAVG